MKFCKNLQQIVEISDPAWAPYWTNYKMLKVSARGKRRGDSRPFLAQSERTNLGVFLTCRPLSWVANEGASWYECAWSFVHDSGMHFRFPLQFRCWESNAPLHLGSYVASGLKGLTVGGIESPNAFLLCFCAWCLGRSNYVARIGKASS